MAKAIKATRAAGGVRPAPAMENGELVRELAHQAVRAGDGRLAELAAEFLARLGPGEVPRLVEAAAGSRGAGHRRRALAAVARIGVVEDGLDRAVLAGLAVRDPDERVRWAALLLCEELRRQDAVEAERRAAAGAGRAALTAAGAEGRAEVEGGRP